MVSGPYTAGGVDGAQRDRNLAAMNEAALVLLRAGHLPVIGVNLALPMIAAAGDRAFDEIMIPVSLALAERCDACVRIGGRSAGADVEVERFRRAGKPVFDDLEVALADLAGR
jgi:hypothetical protein